MQLMCSSRPSSCSRSSVGAWSWWIDAASPGMIDQAAADAQGALG